MMIQQQPQGGEMVATGVINAGTVDDDVQCPMYGKSWAHAHAHGHGGHGRVIILSKVQK
jgi:hypothetical protein